MVLESITQQQHASICYQLTFQNGFTFEADVVIGCDGTHSNVRRFILSPEHEAMVEPIFAGLWDAHGEISPQDAVTKFGSELFRPDRPRAMAIVGEGACVMFYPYDDGAKYRVIMSAVADQTFDKTSWKKPITRDFLEQYSIGDKEFQDRVISLLLADTPRSGIAFSQFEHPNTPTYVRDCACVIGDAAHAVVPWMAQGACLATEDCAVLSATLGSTSYKAEIASALDAYDRIRRSRVENVRNLCREVSKVLTGQYSTDPGIIAELNPKQWWDYVGEIDMKAHINEALHLMETDLGIQKHN